MEIKNIIFDIGNVLTRFCWDEFYADFGYSEEMVERLGRATVKSPVWSEIDRGVWTNQQLLDSFIKNDPDIEKDLRRVFQNLHGIVRKVEYAVPWIQKLKAAGYHCYYLSNFSERARSECDDALDFLEYMDGGILSYQEKLIKPQPEIYELLLNRYHLTAEESVFLDDTERNLPPAREFGIKTILFANKEQAVQELEELGVVTGKAERK